MKQKFKVFLKNKLTANFLIFFKSFITPMFESSNIYSSLNNARNAFFSPKVWNSLKILTFKEIALRFLDIRVFPSILCFCCVTFLLIRSYSTYTKSEADSVHLNCETSRSIPIGPLFSIFLKYSFLMVYYYFYKQHGSFSSTIICCKASYIAFGFLDIAMIIGILCQSCIGMITQKVFNILPFIYLSVIRMLIYKGAVVYFFPTFILDLICILFLTIEIITNRDEMIKFISEYCKKLKEKIFRKEESN